MSNTKLGCERLVKASPYVLGELLGVSQTELGEACRKALEEDPSIARTRPSCFMKGRIKNAEMERALGRGVFKAEEIRDKKLLLILLGGSSGGLYVPKAPLRFDEEHLRCVIYFYESEVYRNGREDA